MNQPTCIIFGRCSKQSQDYSRQLHELDEFASQLRYKVVDTIASKITGKKTYTNRPDLQELFGVVKTKKIDKVLILEISRLGRKAKDIRNTVDYLHQNNVSIVFKNLGGLESLDKDGNESFVVNIIISIYAELAQEELRFRPIGSNKSCQEFLKKYSKLANDLKNGLSLNKCMKIHNVSKNTVIKVKKCL